MIKFFKFVTDSNLFIALCSTGLYLTLGIEYQLNIELQKLGFIFALTFLGYHALRFIPYLKGEELSYEFAAQYREYKWPNILIVLFCSGLLLLELWHLPYTDLFILIPAFIIFLLYETLIFKNFALRKLPYSKPFVISLVWTLICAGLYEERSFLMITDCFFFIFFLCLPFDMKDRPQDQAQSIKTFATEFTSKLQLGITCSVIIISTLAYIISESSMYFILAPIYLTGLYIPNKTRLFYYYFFDGLIIFRLLLAVISDSQL